MSIRPTSFIVRAATSGDEGQLARLNGDFNGSSPSAEQIRVSLESLPEMVLVAEEAGIIKAFLALQVMHSFCYTIPWIEVTELYVDPTCRRQGIASALCSEAVRIAQRLGVAQLWLRTNGGNEQARRVYREAGFEVTDEVVCRRFIKADIP